MAEDLHRHPHDGAENDLDVAAGRAEDEAQRSLADALRVSFRLLTVIMIVFVALFLWTGVETIQPDEVGVKTFFGRITDTAEEGLEFAWPFPIGRIITVSTKAQRTTIEDFWMFETAEERTRPLSERSTNQPGLRPGYDGALLTGDRGLLHVRLNCTYKVGNVQNFVTHVADSADDPKVIETIRSAVCKAAIRAGATRTVDALQRMERTAFAAQVRRVAQDELDGLDTGIEITELLAPEATWPIRALPAYNAAQRAVSEAERKRNAARGEAEKTLHDAAGSIYPELVGRDVYRIGIEVDEAERGGNLIEEYNEARNAGDTERAQRLLERIDEILLSNRLGGSASRIIAEARSEKTAIEQQVLSRERRFRELLPRYEESGQFLLARLWAATRDRILSNALVEKFYVPGGDGPPTVIYVNRDPGIVNEIQREMSREDNPQEGQ